MTTPTFPKANRNTLTECRQAVDTRIVQKRRDALFETLDAVLAGGTFASFAYLSQRERCRRRWPSLDAAGADGQVNGDAFRHLLMHPLPQDGICVFPLDGSSRPRPRSRVLADLHAVYHASSDVTGGKVTVGYPSSLLAWCAAPHPRWSLPLAGRQMSSQQTAHNGGREQMQALADARHAWPGALDIVAADGKYGNGHFLSRVSSLRVGIVARLRSDRVVSRPAEPIPGQRGRPPTDGERFGVTDEQPWGEPDERQELQTDHAGNVRRQRWNSLRDTRAPHLTVAIVCAEPHREQAKPPAAVWVAWLPPVDPPAHIAITAHIMWTASVNRWPMEPGMRCRTETLGWTLPRFQHAQTGDTWTQLVALAH